MLKFIRSLKNTANLIHTIFKHNISEFYWYHYKTVDLYSPLHINEVIQRKYYKIRTSLKVKKVSQITDLELCHLSQA